MNEINFYPIENFEPHPNNPRKDLGDLTELADSIKAMGVLQNLIVVEEGGKLRVVAGHRRLAAAKKAGLKELPAVKRELTMRQQQEMMLTENLQRTDLTLTEQAEGIQLLIDLGETVEEICKATGFSERTVYHRINIAKLDKKAIAKAEKTRGEQLSLKDFILLEQVKDIKRREKLLKESGGARDFKWHVDQAVKEEKTLENTKDLEAKAIKAKMEKGEWKNSWDGVSDYETNRWGIIKKLPKTKFYAVKDEYICFYNTAKEKKESKKEQEKKAKEKKRREMLKMVMQLEESLLENVRSYTWHLIDDLEDEERDGFLLQLLRLLAIGYHCAYSDAEEIKKIETTNDLLKYMAADTILDERLFDRWNGRPMSIYSEEKTEFQKYLDYLFTKGFKLTEDEKNIMAGVHPAQMEIKKIDERK